MVEDVTDDESGDDISPFHDIPALKEFQLSGARVALSRRRNARQPSDQSIQLWTHARGLTTDGNWRGVRANKITSVYTSHPDAAPFTAQSRDTVFPLPDFAARKDDQLAAQQTRLGAAAHAVCLALARLNEVTTEMADQTSAFFVPRSQSAGSKGDIRQRLDDDIATPLGHALRLLAAECSLLCKDRRQLCLNTVADQQGRTVIDRVLPSSTALFDGDINAIVNTIKQRHDAGGAFRPAAPTRQSRDRAHRQPSFHREERKRPHEGPQRGRYHSQPFRFQPYGANPQRGNSFRRNAFKPQKKPNGKQQA